jgi:hypothetical protein
MRVEGYAVIKNAVYLCGEYAIRDAIVTERPIIIEGLLPHTIIVFRGPDPYIKIGCEVHPLAYWRKNLPAIARKYGGQKHVAMGRQLGTILFGLRRF